MKYYITLLAILMNCYFLQAQATDTTVVERSTGGFNRLAQDSTVIKHTDNPTYSSLFSITTDLAQYGLFQPNLGIEINIDTISLGFNFGLVEPSPMFAVNPLADGQFTYPGTVYRGTAFRFYLKIRTKKHPYSYWCFQGVYKKIAFNNISFSDEYRDEILNTYTMDENSTVAGLDILHGNLIAGNDQGYTIDFFYGFGYHIRTRNYTIYNENSSPSYPGPEYNGLTIALPGTYQTVLSIFTPVVGFKVGFNYLKKK